MARVYRQLLDAAAGGYKVRIKAGRHVDAWFYVMTVDRLHAVLLGTTPVQVALVDISVLVEDEQEKSINRWLDKERGA